MSAPTCFSTEVPTSGSQLNNVVPVNSPRWHSGPATCTSLILVMNCIVLNAFLG